MAIDEFTEAAAEEKLDHFCENRIPPHAKEQVRMSWSFWRNSIILYEERKAYMDRSRWIKMKVARMDFDAETKGWTLWAYDRNSKPLYYPNLHPDVSVRSTASLDEVIAEIDNDPTCIFFG